MNWLLIATLILLSCTGVEAKGKKKHTPPSKQKVVAKEAKTEPAPPLPSLTSDFNNVPFPETNAKQLLVVEENHGCTLLERSADEPMPPSSMIKILSAQTTLDLLAKSKLKMDSEVIVSPAIVEEVRKWGASTMFAAPDKPVSIENLLKGHIIVSGCDASMALAEALCGSEKVFAAHMTETAHAMGANQTQCTNASGLPDPNMLTTCRDLITITRSFMKKYPEHYPLFGVDTFTHNGITQPNRNPFTGWGMFPCDGVKTGYTPAGGYGVVGSCLSEEASNPKSWRFIAVLNGLSSKQERFAESKTISTWVFQHFASLDHTVCIELPVKLGNLNKVAVGAHLKLVLPKGAKANITINHPSYLKGAHKKRASIGTMTITSPSLKKTITIPLTVFEEVKEAQSLQKLWGTLLQMFASPPTTITTTQETTAAMA